MPTNQNVKQFKNREILAQESDESTTASHLAQDITTALNQCLAHSIELGSRIKQAHWSAKGDSFYVFRKMADDFTVQLAKQSDKLSARIVAIEGVPNWTPEKVAETSLLPSYPTEMIGVADHIQALTANYQQVTKELQSMLGQIKKSDDYVTSTVITNFYKILDEQKAFLIAHSGLAWLEKSKRQYG